MYLLQKDIEQLVEDCDDSKILDRIAKAFKIPKTKNDRVRSKKSICDCIKFLRVNADQLDYNDIIQQREETMVQESPVRAAELQKKCESNNFQS